ncbi:MAG TPA: rhodanese-like domain-containing protein [Bryobacteraceae bacterium]|nr:rhodanese-like domain-containing protein [Bryobacteraceae bacterium]
MTRRDLLLEAAALCALPALAGADQSGEPKQLSAEELEKLLEKPGNIFFLDVRPPEEIKALGTIKGYVNIPLAQLEDRLGEIPKNKLIVTL